MEIYYKGKLYQFKKELLFQYHMSFSETLYLILQKFILKYFLKFR